MRYASGYFRLIVLPLLVSLTACHQEADEFRGLKSISVQPSVNYTSADGKSQLPLTVTVLDKAGNPVNYPDSTIELYANGVRLAGLRPHNFPYTPHAYYRATQPGAISLQAKWGPLVSDPVSITARTEQVYPVVKLPVIFHLPKNFDFTKIGTSFADLIRGVNELYRDRKANSDPNHADSFLEFYLAQSGPDSQALPIAGVNQLAVDDPPTNQESGALVDSVLAHWCVKEYVNVFVKINWAKGKYPAGYSFSYIGAYTTDPYPGDASCESLSKSKAAIMIYDESTLTSEVIAHEFGHMLGLNHTFGDCFWYDNPHVKDTPKQEEARTDGSNYKRTCKQVPFLATNLMDYYNRRFGFTSDQVAVMRTILNTPTYLPIKRPSSANPAGGRTGITQHLPPAVIVSCAQ